MKTVVKRTARILALCLLFTFFATPCSYALIDQTISSTFIQLYQSHHSWTADQWNALFDEFEATGVTELIIQYGVNDDFAHYQTDDFETSATPPMETILRIAEQRGVEVIFGLNHDDAYWDMLWADDASLAQFMEDSYAKSMFVATQIHEFAQHYTNFKGWYITEEIEERTWNYYERLDILLDFMYNLSHDLKTLTPAAKVAFSTYINEPPAANVYHETMNQILANSYVTDLYFQDGVGTGLVPLDLVDDYAMELKNASALNDCNFHVIAELFDDGLAPAPIDQIIWQIETANQVQPKSICSFATPHYMSQFGKTGAEQLLGDYLAWLATLEPTPEPRPDPEPALDLASVNAISYATFGGKRSDKHLAVQFSVIDSDTNEPIANALVQVSFENSAAKVFYSGVINSDVNGVAQFSVNNIKRDYYTTCIDGITAAGYEWDGVTPANQFTK